MMKPVPVGCGPAFSLLDAGAAWGKTTLARTATGL
jgi:hypothetical protein